MLVISYKNGTANRVFSRRIYSLYTAKSPMIYGFVNFKKPVVDYEETFTAESGFKNSIDY